MLRSSTTTIALAIAVTVLAGCGGDKSVTKAETTTATAAAPVATTPAPPPTRTQATAPHRETSPQELAKRSKARAEKAANAGAKTCPTLTKPAEAKDITVLHISCATAKKVIFATTPTQRSGFVCDIVNESFSDVPAVEYSCNRKADKATLGYTAVG